MTAPKQSNHVSIALAIQHLTTALDSLRQALTLVSGVAPNGHDATASVYDARRAVEVANAKVIILQRRLP